MILVRSEFQCKWGRVNEVIDRFKQMEEMMQNQNVIKRTRIMTDMSGRFDTVIVESEVESLDDYHAMLQAMFADPQWQEAQEAAGQNTPYRSGRREYYKIEAVYELEPAF